MKKNFCAVVTAITAILLAVIWLFNNEYTLNNRNVLFSCADLSSNPDSYVLNGITVEHDSLFFEQPTSNIAIASTDKKSLKDLHIYVDDIFGSITCQIYYATEPLGVISGDHCSELIKLNKGLNIISFNEDEYYTMWVVFRCADHTNARLDISYISMPDSLSAFSAVLSFAVIVFSAILIFKRGITQETKNMLKIKFLRIKESKWLRVCFFGALSYITALALTIKYVPLSAERINGTYSGSDKVRAVIEKLTVVMSETSPIVQFIIFLSVYSLLKALYKRIEHKINIPAIIFSLIMTITTMCGDSFYYQDSLDMLITKDFAQVVVNIIVFIGYETVLYLLSAYLWESIINFNVKKYCENDKKFSRIYGFHKKHPVISLSIIILIFWLPYAIIYYPGIIPPDATVQMDMWFASREWNNNSPYFSTFLICSFIEIGKLLGSDNIGVCLFSSLQMVILAITMSVCINILKDFGAPRIVRIIWFLSICILPVYPCSAIQVGKDTNYTISVAIFTIIMMYIVKNPEKYLNNIKVLIFWTIDMIYMSLVRHNGIYVLILSASVVFLFIKNRKNFVRILVCFIAAIVSFNVLNICFDNIIEKNNIEKGYEIEEKNEEYTNGNALHQVIYNITARYVKEYSNEITDEQRQIIDNVLDYDRISEVYQPEITDYVSAQFRNNVTLNEYNMFLKQFAELFFKHPLVYIEGFFNKCYGYVYTNSSGKAKQYVWVGINSYVKQIEEVEIVNIPLFLNQHVRVAQMMTLFRSIPIISVLSNVGIYSWNLIYVIFVLIKKRKYRYLFVTIPVVASLAVCVLSPVNAYIRYALPVIFISPLLLAPCFPKSKPDK